MSAGGYDGYKVTDPHRVGKPCPQLDLPPPKIARQTYAVIVSQPFDTSMGRVFDGLSELSIQTRHLAHIGLQPGDRYDYRRLTAS